MAQPANAKRPRVLMPVDTNTSTDEIAAAANLSEYEIQRLERIKHNQQRMQDLGLLDAVTDLRAHNEQQQRAPPPPRAFKPRAPALAPAPTRRSTRGARDATDDAQPTSEAASSQPQPASALLTLEEYFAANNIDCTDAIRAEGFRGWVSPEICKEFGIAGSAAEAWESQGGGKFTRKIDKKAIPAHIRAKGWSDAKAMAATQLLKNPNQFFYRHTAPGVPQAQGDWSAEEHDAFVATMRQHGVGDKWGLFASYIPHRVGYQCSAYYRDVIVPSGLVLDDRFRMTRSGKAEYVG